MNTTLSLVASPARLMMVAAMAAMLFFHAGSLALAGTVPLDSLSEAQRGHYCEPACKKDPVQG